jgi:hypothetical protein
MKPHFEPDKKPEDPYANIADTLGLSPELGTLTSTSSADQVTMSAAITSAQVIQPVEIAASVSALAMSDPAHLEDNCNQPHSSFDTTMQPNLVSTQSEQDPLVSCPRYMVPTFTDADSVFFLGYLCEYPEFTRFWRHFCTYYCELFSNN